MKILRIGSSSISYSRYLDLLEYDEVEKIIFFVQEHDLLIRGIENAAKCFHREKLYNDKVVIYKYNNGYLYRFFAKLISLKIFCISNMGMGILIQRSIELFGKFLIPSKLLNNILIKEKPDFIWSGSNDFDGSNLLTWIIGCKFRIPIVRSYKEHRCKYLLEEKQTLLHSNALIFTSMRNKNFFDNLYHIPSSNKYWCGDEDWRYSGLINFVNALKVDKLSKNDQEPHIVILSAVVQCRNDKRNGNRYNYYDMIRSFIGEKIHVHLHTKKIDVGRDEEINIYIELERNSKYFHIEKALDLESDLNSYSILKRYDAGVLHNFCAEDKFEQFNTMNIPNRLYEYQLAEIQPLLIENTMLDVEEVLMREKYGLIGKNIADLSFLLYKYIESNKNIGFGKVKSYRDFVKVLCDSYLNISGIYSND